MIGAAFIFVAGLPPLMLGLLVMAVHKVRTAPRSPAQVTQRHGASDLGRRSAAVADGLRWFLLAGPVEVPRVRVTETGDW